ncbi:hypothetical protein SUT007_09170 [Streptococcus parasuis]|nr:hypothetical protein SUT007_09170 [Streptococcus parasuis]
MVTFAQGIREGKMDIFTDDFEKLTGDKALTVIICSNMKMIFK